MMASDSQNILNVLIQVIKQVNTYMMIFQITFMI